MTSSQTKTRRTFKVIVRGIEFELSQSQIMFDAPNLFSTAFLDSEMSESQTGVMTTDRNPATFALIVEYMAGYDIFPLPLIDIKRPALVISDPGCTLRALRNDAEYYCMQRLSKQCEAESRKSSETQTCTKVGKYGCWTVIDLIEFIKVQSQHSEQLAKSFSEGKKDSGLVYQHRGTKIEMPKRNKYSIYSIYFELPTGNNRHSIHVEHGVISATGDDFSVEADGITGSAWHLINRLHNVKDVGPFDQVAPSKIADRRFQEPSSKESPFDAIVESLLLTHDQTIANSDDNVMKHYFKIVYAKFAAPCR